MTSDDDARRKKLRMRAWRRGFREADLILGPFADRHVPNFSDAELDLFEALLQESDHDIYGWILERTSPPSPYDGELMSQLRAFRDEAHKSVNPRGSGNG